jgi:hypothetical protein
MTVVIKGKSVAGGMRLASHLERLDTNERMELIELRDVAATDLRGALQEMEAVASGCPNCQKPFYHASINTRADEHLTPEQRMASIDRLEEKLGLTGQPRVVVVHEKDGREHCHIVWLRIDLDRMRVISDSHNYRNHELVARALEREFGHARVQGAHVERDGQARPERTPSHKEMQQAARTGVSPQQAKQLMTELWRMTDNGQAFQAALDEKGWMLARGDRRDFVAVDPEGGTHSLARRIEGAKAKDVRERLADLDPRSLPGVAEAKQAQQQVVRAPQMTTSIAAAAPERAEPAAGSATMAATVAATVAAPAAPRGKEESRAMDAAARSLEGVASGAARVADGLATLASRAIEFLSDFFGGASSPSPSHEQGPTAPPPSLAPEPSPAAGFVAPSKSEQTIEEFLEQERREWQQQHVALQNLRDAGPAITSAEDLQEESEQKRSRDRGGGQSL